MKIKTKTRRENTNWIWCCANSAIELVDMSEDSKQQKKNMKNTGDNSENGRGDIFTKEALEILMICKQHNKQNHKQIKDWQRNLKKEKNNVDENWEMKGEITSGAIQVNEADRKQTRCWKEWWTNT